MFKSKSIIKVLLVGEDSEGSSERFLFNAFSNIEEVEIKFVASNRFFKLRFLNRIINKFLATPIYFGTDKLNKVVLSETNNFHPDFVLFFKPILIEPQTVIQLKKLSKVFSWYPDYVYFRKTASSYFYESIPFYDCHFSFNFANSEELKKFGAKMSLFLPCAAAPSVHRPVPVSLEEKESIGADIVFIGTYANEKRTEYLERLCRDGFDIKIYGNDWERHPQNSCLRHRGCIQFKALYGEEMAKIINASKITVAFVRAHNMETLACRTYEIPACGGFMLHERTEKIGEVFEEGREAEFFSSYEEFKKKIEIYLNNNELRKEIAMAGHKKVYKGGHLFKDRASFVLEIFKSLGNNE